MHCRDAKHKAVLDEKVRRCRGCDGQSLWPAQLLGRGAAAAAAVGKQVGGSQWGLPTSRAHLRSVGRYSRTVHTTSASIRPRSLPNLRRAGGRRVGGERLESAAAAAVGAGLREATGQQAQLLLGACTHSCSVLEGGW